MPNKTVTADGIIAIIFWKLYAQFGLFNKVILKHCGSPNNWSYLIRWKGYTAEEDTWLKEAELRNATEFLCTYKKRIKISPK